MKVIELSNVDKKFGEKTVINQFSLKIEKGKKYAIVGRSGCGKSTLLNIMGGIEKPTSGNVVILGNNNVLPHSFKVRKLLRNHISFLFQNYALSDNDTVYKNLEMALTYNKDIKNKKKAISSALIKVGLEGFEQQKIYTLSGGEQQRVAIARLLLKPTEIILADEPTGNLDIENRDIIFELLMELNRAGKTIVLVTHDLELAQKCDVVVDL
ncbi:MAG: putative bacteriocin export ABC transporter [Oscillospiraceae bacterium]|nr:putative bacteriocin export ABC transporter [Oscillospiraceae bacterium]